MPRSECFPYRCHGSASGLLFGCKFRGGGADLLTSEEESTGAWRNLDQEAEGSSFTEQSQLERPDGCQAKPEMREPQLQQVSLEALDEEQEQLSTVSEVEEVESTPLPNPRTFRAERKPVHCWSARVLARRQPHSL